MRGGVAHALAQAFDDVALGRRGVGRGIGQQRGERRAHAGPGHDGVHGQLAQADPQLDLLERQAPVLGEAGHVAGHEEQGVGLGRPGQGQRVLAEGAPGQVAGGRPELHAEEDRSEGQGELAEQALQAGPAVGVELGQVHGGDGGGALLLGLDHRLENGAVRLEQAERPLPGSDGLEGHPGSAARGGGDAGGLGDVQLGHPGQVLEGDAHERVGGLVLPVVGGHAEGQGAGGLEPIVAATGRSRPDDLEQVAEETAHWIVRVVGTEHAH